VITPSIALYSDNPHSAQQQQDNILLTKVRPNGRNDARNANLVRNE